MRVVVLVQSEHWLDRAGVRIRYRRIAPRLERLGCELVVKAIGSWMADDLADMVILSKCTDARAMIVASELRVRGIAVGIDLFDDYFSNPTSSCYAHRQALREIAPYIDFFLCSTVRMEEIGNLFAENKPSHVLNDPFDDFDLAVLARRLGEKACQARENGRFEVLWFGNGSNPVFPVGLTDLAAFAPSLRPFMGGPFDVQLRVLTNADALNAANLASLRRLPLPVVVERWSEQAERDALDRALVSFLPVNYQNFSIAKSLNRAVSALTGGTQILSTGYQLYRELLPLVYRDAEAVNRDLGRGELLLRPETLDGFARHMSALADPDHEAEALLAFLNRIQRQDHLQLRSRSPMRAVLHGSRSPTSVVAMCRTAGWMSIGSPFARTSDFHDVHIGFFEGSPLPQCLLTREVAGALSADSRRGIRPMHGGGGRHFAFVADLPENDAGETLRRLRQSMISSRAGRIVHYARVMAAMEAVCTDIFGDIRFFRSEREDPLMGLQAFPPHATEMSACQ